MGKCVVRCFIAANCLLLIANISSSLADHFILYLVYLKIRFVGFLGAFLKLLLNIFSYVGNSCTFVPEKISRKDLTDCNLMC